MPPTLRVYCFLADVCAGLEVPFMLMESKQPKVAIRASAADSFMARVFRFCFGIPGNMGQS